jgi:ABC-type multidrug transport system permease subunit
MLQQYQNLQINSSNCPSLYLFLFVVRFVIVKLFRSADHAALPSHCLRAQFYEKSMVHAQKFDLMFCSTCSIFFSWFSIHKLRKFDYHFHWSPSGVLWTAREYDNRWIPSKINNNYLSDAIITAFIFLLNGNVVVLKEPLREN